MKLRSGAGGPARRARRIWRPLALAAVIAGTGMSFVHPVFGDSDDLEAHADPLETLDCAPLEPIQAVHSDYTPPAGIDVRGAPSTPEDALEAWMAQRYPAVTPDDFAVVSEASDHVRFALSDSLGRTVAVALVGPHADGWGVHDLITCDVLFRALLLDSAGEADIGEAGR